MEENSTGGNDVEIKVSCVFLHKRSEIETELFGLKPAGLSKFEMKPNLGWCFLCLGVECYSDESGIFPCRLWCLRLSSPQIALPFCSCALYCPLASDFSSKFPSCLNLHQRRVWQREGKGSHSLGVFCYFYLGGMGFRGGKPLEAQRLFWVIVSKKSHHFRAGEIKRAQKSTADSPWTARIPLPP